MNNETCKTIRSLLVDYCDGELPADQVRQVADHLGRCNACREEIDLLKRSLELAIQVWDEVGEPEIARIPHAPREAVCARHAAHAAIPHAEREEYIKRRPQYALWISSGLAVCICVVLAVFGYRIFLQPKLASPASPSIASAGTHANQSKEDMDVMKYIDREDRSARLAASIQFLAGEPGMEQYKQSTEQYLKQTYADTTAARMLNKQ